MNRDIDAALGSTMQALLGFGTPPVLETTAPSVGTRRSPGRPSYELDDRSLSAKIIHMHEKGEVRSIEAGARALWTFAAGYGSSDSKVDRVAKHARALRRAASE
jgi:hypothetical protein